MKGLSHLLDEVYNAMEGSESMRAFAECHNIQSAAVLTLYNDLHAERLADHLAPRIAGKTVVEIGGGIGLLSLHMGRHAKRVYCIEANPMWSWTFAQIMLAKKPKNVSYLFGAADEFLGAVRGDVAVVCTHSGLDSMMLAAAQFAPVVIDVWGEIIAKEPERFDSFAREMRKVV